MVQKVCGILMIIDMVKFTENSKHARIRHVLLSSIFFFLFLGIILITHVSLFWPLNSSYFENRIQFRRDLNQLTLKYRFQDEMNSGSICKNCLRFFGLTIILRFVPSATVVNNQIVFR